VVGALTGESVFFPFVAHGGIKLACIRCHLGVPAKSRKGYMTMVEFATSVVLVGSVSHALAKGFVVVCAAFFEWGFGLPPHQFLCSLLRSYGLEQHHLTSSGILHMAAFVTLCEAYIGIEPLLKLWSHFFQDQL
jgi:hypothetical protein